MPFEYDKYLNNKFSEYYFIDRYHIDDQKWYQESKHYTSENRYGNLGSLINKINVPNINAGLKESNDLASSTLIKHNKVFRILAVRNEALMLNMVYAEIGDEEYEVLGAYAGTSDGGGDGFSCGLFHKNCYNKTTISDDSNDFTSLVNKKELEKTFQELERLRSTFEEYDEDAHFIGLSKAGLQFVSKEGKDENGYVEVYSDGASEDFIYDIQDNWNLNFHIEYTETLEEIEIGKQYDISNKNKWGVVEVRVFTHETKCGVNVQTEWKSSHFRVTPKNQEEIDILVDALENGTGISLDDIEDHEWLEYGDCTDYFVFHDGWTEEDKKALDEEYYDGDWFDRTEMLKESGFHNDDYSEIYIEGIVIKEVG